MQRGERHLAVRARFSALALGLRGKRWQLLGGICRRGRVRSEGACSRRRCARRARRRVAEENVCDLAVVVFIFLFVCLLAVIVCVAILVSGSCGYRRCIRRCCCSGRFLVFGDMSALSLLASIVEHKHIVYDLDGSVLS